MTDKQKSFLAALGIIALGVAAEAFITQAFHQRQEFDRHLQEAMQDCWKRHMQVVVRGPVVECHT